VPVSISYIQPRTLAIVKKKECKAITAVGTKPDSKWTFSLTTMRRAARSSGHYIEFEGGGAFVGRCAQQR